MRNSSILKTEMPILRCKIAIYEFFELVDTFVGFRKHLFIHPDEVYLDKEGTDELVRFIVIYSMKCDPNNLPKIILPNKYIESVKSQIAHLKIIRSLSYFGSLEESKVASLNPAEVIILEPTFNKILVQKNLNGNKELIIPETESSAPSDKNPLHEIILKNYISKFEPGHERLRIKINHPLIEALCETERSFFRTLLLDDLKYWKEKINKVVLVIENDHDEIDEAFLPSLIYMIKWVMENKKILEIENPPSAFLEKLESRKLIVPPYVTITNP